MTTADWRSFYRDDQYIQMLIEEIGHARAVVLRVEELRLVIERCWRAETDCDLAALVELRGHRPKRREPASSYRRSRPGANNAD